MIWIVFLKRAPDSRNTYLGSSCPIVSAFGAIAVHTSVWWASRHDVIEAFTVAATSIFTPDRALFVVGLGDPLPEANSRTVRIVRTWNLNSLFDIVAVGSLCLLRDFLGVRFGYFFAKELNTGIHLKRELILHVSRCWLRFIKLVAKIYNIFELDCCRDCHPGASSLAIICRSVNYQRRRHVSEALFLHINAPHPLCAIIKGLSCDRQFFSSAVVVFIQVNRVAVGNHDSVDIIIVSIVIFDISFSVFLDPARVFVCIEPARIVRAVIVAEYQDGSSLCKIVRPHIERGQTVIVSGEGVFRGTSASLTIHVWAVSSWDFPA